jgi:uncharacterized membrane protein YphA (DoxX/SURF4 family)
VIPGLKSRAGCWWWGSFSFIVVANAIFHRYWLVPDAARRNVTRLLLLNGIAILGGLLLLFESVK